MMGYSVSGRYQWQTKHGQQLCRRSPSMFGNHRINRTGREVIRMRKTNAYPPGIWWRMCTIWNKNWFLKHDKHFEFFFFQYVFYLMTYNTLCTIIGFFSTNFLLFQKSVHFRVVYFCMSSKTLRVSLNTCIPNLRSYVIQWKI